MPNNIIAIFAERNGKDLQASVHNFRFKIVL